MVVYKRALAALAYATLALLALPARTEPSGLAGDIERTFDRFFLFTTSGNGRYVIYQQVEDPLGIVASSDVVCMPRECLLQIAEVPDSTLANAAGRNIGRVRERFRAVRDAYRAMRSAAPGDRPAAVDAWHAATDRLRPCLEAADSC